MTPGQLREWAESIERGELMATDDEVAYRLRKEAALLERHAELERELAAKAGECEGLHAAQADRAIALANAEANLAVETALTEKLQRALMFWMPAIAGNGTEAGERAASDSYLLIGYHGPDEKGAADIGWIVVSNQGKEKAGGETAIIPAGEIIHVRAIPFRLVSSALVSGANIDAALRGTP